AQDEVEESFDLYGDLEEDNAEEKAGRDDESGFLPEDTDMSSIPVNTDVKDSKSPGQHTGSSAKNQLDSGPKGPCSVTVNKLNWWTSDAELETFFAECGKIRKIRFEEDKACGKSKGIAHIEFVDRFRLI
ncbi:hypothetical protein GUITHDRAFT_63549, partial [Guillardia theta CCMP2712]